MHFVYIIVSVPRPDRYYVGLTENVRQRVGHHNQGIVLSTAPFRPWRLRTAVCFSSRTRAADFERYLKTGSGNAFLRKRIFLTIFRPLPRQCSSLTGLTCPSYHP